MSIFMVYQVASPQLNEVIYTEQYLQSYWTTNTLTKGCQFSSAIHCCMCYIAMLTWNSLHGLQKINISLVHATTSSFCAIHLKVYKLRMLICVTEHWDLPWPLQWSLQCWGLLAEFHRRVFTDHQADMSALIQSRSAHFSIGSADCTLRIYFLSLTPNFKNSLKS